MIETISKKYAMSIKRAYPPADAEVIAYEVGRKLNFRVTIALTLLVSWFTGHLIGAIIAMCTFAFARRITGGLHLNLTMCTIVSVALFSTAPVIPMSTGAVVILSILLSIFYILLSADLSRWSIVIVCLANLNILSVEVVFVLAAQILLVWMQQIQGGAKDE
ncbi:accessory gene regulator B family protein [Paenibacillus silvae]|uniref:accessory gene regulator B family protein n=1 Tax=Paenibacillus silvae TaxID=1325358 RepID=UPI0025A006CC|nr:accessory gene regulator B family protein [Paenibacillus silvae]MDM5278778.1 accessory gene regulator B family protein [Paenibacillus silvae]